MEAAESKYKNKIITIPNILSLFRLCMIPLIIWVYLGLKDYRLAGFLVIFSGLTDVVDGMISRKFNMISDVGKVLDPFADKATQFVVVILLAIRFPLMWITIAIGVVKEVFNMISGYLIVKKRGIVLSAEWYGKVATVILTAMMALHLIWPDLNPTLSVVISLTGSAAVLMATVMYMIRNIKYLIKK